MNSSDTSLLPERMADESTRWFARFLAYSRLPPASRSVERVCREECAAKCANGSAKGDKRRAPGAWHRASSRFRWQERAAALDAHVMQLEAEQIAAQRKAECEKRRQLSTTLSVSVAALLTDAAMIRANPASVAR